MAMIRLPPDFKEFLQLLSSHEVEYLVVGGYAVGYHGYPRATVDLDVWVAIHPKTAHKIVETLKGFGFEVPNLTPSLFLQEKKVIWRVSPSTSSPSRISRPTRGPRAGRRIWRIWQSCLDRFPGARRGALAASGLLR